MIADCPVSDPNGAATPAIDPADFYHALWDNPVSSVFILAVIDQGAAYEFVAFNPAAASQCPIPAEQLRGKRLRETFPPDTANRYCHHYSACVHSGQVVSFEEDVVLPSARTWWRMTIYPVKNETGEVIQLIVTANDITARCLAEKTLEESRRVLQQVIDTIPAVIFWKDREGRYLGSNQRLAQMAGYDSPAAIVGKTDDDMPWTAEETAGFIQDDRCVMSSNKPKLNIIEPLQRADGEQAWLRTSKMPLHDNNGAVTGILSVVEDITARKLVEDEQDRLLAILEATPDVVGIADAEGNNCYLNRAGQLMFDIPPEKTDQFHISDVVHPSVAEYVMAEAMPAAIEKGSWRGESMVIDAFGEPVPVSQVIVCHRAKDGSIAYFSSIMRDIRQRKAAEAALKATAEHQAALNQELKQTMQQLQLTQAQMIQAEKMSGLGQMVAGVAHEINNPVSFIHGNLQPAKGYIQDLLDLISLYGQVYPEPAAEIEDAIEEMDLAFIRQDLPKLLTSMTMGTRRIREIVLSLRNFSRLDESEMKTVNLHDGIDSTLVILNHRLKANGRQHQIKVIKRYGELPLVDCFSSQLNQVLMNILANAIDALECHPQPQITVTTALQPGPDGKRATIQIADNGPGIPPEIQPQILDPFFTTKPVGKGTGMGMSISYQIITDRHRGELTFTSQVGQGTTFVIAIPIRQPGAT